MRVNSISWPQAWEKAMTKSLLHVVWVLYLTRCKGCVSFKTNQRQKKPLHWKKDERTNIQKKQRKRNKENSYVERTVCFRIYSKVNWNTTYRKPTWSSFFVSVESVFSVVLYWVANLIIVFFYSSQWRTCWVLTWIKGQLTFSWRPPSVKFLHR